MDISKLVNLFVAKKDCSRIQDILKVRPATEDEICEMLRYFSEIPEEDRDYNTLVTIIRNCEIPNQPKFTLMMANIIECAAPEQVRILVSEWAAPAYVGWLNIILSSSNDDALQMILSPELVERVERESIRATLMRYLKIVFEQTTSGRGAKFHIGARLARSLEFICENMVVEKPRQASRKSNYAKVIAREVCQTKDLDALREFCDDGILSLSSTAAFCLRFEWQEGLDYLIGRNPGEIVEFGDDCRFTIEKL